MAPTTQAEYTAAPSQARASFAGVEDPKKKLSYRCVDRSEWCNVELAPRLLGGSIGGCLYAGVVWAVVGSRGELASEIHTGAQGWDRLDAPNASESLSIGNSRPSPGGLGVVPGGKKWNSSTKQTDSGTPPPSSHHIPVIII